MAEARAARAGLRPYLLRLLILVAAALLPAAEVEAQSRADSVALMRAIGGALRDEARQALARVVCYERVNPCPATGEDSSDVFMAELARAAAVAIVHHRRDGGPACPWGHDRPSTGAGFRVGVSTIRFDAGGDTARVTVLQSCNALPVNGRRGFARDFEYLLARQADGEWRVVERRLTRIT
jgi:hypothetical protein